MINPKTYMTLGTYPQDPNTKLFYYNLDFAINKEIIDFYVDTANEVLAEQNVSTPNLFYIQGLSNLPLAIADSSSVNHVAMINEKSPISVKINNIILPITIPPMSNNPTLVLLDSLLYDNTYKSILGLLKNKITKPITFIVHNTNLSYKNIRAMLEVNLKGVL